MRTLRRILIVVAVTLAFIGVVVYWVVPVASSFYFARKALPVARVVPSELKDKSIAEAPGTKLSYFGYEFEVPWNDLDETQTKLFPTQNPEKTRIDLRFRSGLRLSVAAAPAKSWAKEFAVDFKTPESSFVESDYSFERRLYEFTPDKMNHWSISPQVHIRESFLLIIKSVSLSRSAETGIFNLQNQSYRGFQLGNPQVRQDGIILHMFSDEGSVEMIFFQKDYRSPEGITQPEINRIVRSLHKAQAADLRIANNVKGHQSG